MRLLLPAPADFDFRSAVCSHGFFILPPNRWQPTNATLRTVVNLDHQRAVAVAVHSPGRRCVEITTAAKLPAGAKATIRAAIGRMLRLDEDLSPFHRLCRTNSTHRAASRMRFGRLLRSADLFEDIVKVICTCNVTWRQTVTMVERLVGQWGVPTGNDDSRGFPTPVSLAAASVEDLRQQARLGYRAAYVHDLAVQVADGRLDLTAFERRADSTETLTRQLRQIRGVGPYAAAHLCMLLGRYDQLAIDTELIRLLRQRWPRRKLNPAAIHAHYAAWHPYQFLAYWFELWQDYRQRHGRPDQWSPEETGRRITQPG